MGKTLIIIKPDAVKRNLIGEILSVFEKNHLKILDLKMVHLSRQEAEEFYEVHRGKSFFETLVTYMTSGRCIVAALEGENVVARVRKLCGSTDPSQADEQTIRGKYGINITMNSVHASDSEESARREVKFFFPEIM